MVYVVMSPNEARIVEKSSLNPFIGRMGDSTPNWSTKQSSLYLVLSSISVKNVIWNITSVLK